MKRRVGAVVFLVFLKPVAVPLANSKELFTLEQ